MFIDQLKMPGFVRIKLLPIPNKMINDMTHTLVNLI